MNVVAAPRILEVHTLLVNCLGKSLHAILWLITVFDNGGLPVTWRCKRPNSHRIDELFYKIKHLHWTSSVFVKLDGNILLVVKYLNKTRFQRLRRQLLGILEGI